MEEPLLEKKKKHKQSSKKNVNTKKIQTIINNTIKS